MPVPAVTAENQGQPPTRADRDAAGKLLRALTGYGRHGSRVAVLDSALGIAVEIDLTPGLAALLAQLLGIVAGGKGVALTPIGQMLTTQQAADVLNVSRPFLVSMLERGDMPFELVGKHRRVRSDAVFAYKQQRASQRGNALAALGEIDGDLI